jgi:peptidoglycan/xylan/chitin deacetylase (PgdA/CDA1 family)
MKPSHALRVEQLELRQMFAVTLDNVARAYQSPIDTIRTPQFVSLGWDDNNDPAGIDWVVKAFGDRTDAHGNTILTSFYMNSVGFGPAAPTAADVPPGQSEGSGLDLGATPADLVNAFKTIPAAGHEVGNHTFDHHAQVLAEKGGWDGMVQYLSNQATVADWTKFLVECNAALQDPGGQDLSKVTGFRAPFLEYGKNLYPALSQMGFTYDCSIEALSNEDGQFPFPYTLDTGSVDHASGWKANPDNPNSFQVPNTPGLWEVPAYALRIPDAVEEKPYGLEDIGAKIRAGWASIRPTDVHVTGFDYNIFLGQVDQQGKKTGPGLTGAEVLGLLKYNLDIRLAGNRAPFCFGTHSQYYLEWWVKANAPQVTVAEMRRTITDFLDYARSKPEVRIVSGQQIVDWMRNPTAIDDRPQILDSVGAGGEILVNKPIVTLGNLFTGTTTQVRVNDGPWTTITVDAGGVAALGGLREGANTALFRQVGSDGSPSTAQKVQIRFDSIAPAVPLVAVRRAAPGGLTNDPALRLSRLESDGQIRYSVNGSPWSSVYAPVEGMNAVRVMSIDAAGNQSRPSAPARFTLDRTAAAPTVSLLRDTGSPDDLVTTDGRLRVTGIERGARVEYSADEGRTWTRTFTPTYGRNEVLVRQRDRAGNYSEAADFVFTKVFASGALQLRQVAVYVNNFTHPVFSDSGKVGLLKAGRWDSPVQLWFVIDGDPVKGVSMTVRLDFAEDQPEGDLRRSFSFGVGPQLDTESLSPECFGLIEFAAGFRSDGTFILREKYHGTGDMTAGQTKEFTYSNDTRFRIHFDRVVWLSEGRPAVFLMVKGFYGPPTSPT